MAASKASTQTAGRGMAGPFRTHAHARAATAAANGICQRELSRKVSRERLIVSMWFLTGLTLDQFLNLRQFLRGQVTGFDQAQHKAVGRTAKEPVKHFTDRLPYRLLAAEDGSVDIGTILELTLDFTFAV